MANAKEEFLEHIKGKELLCANIAYGECIGKEVKFNNFCLFTDFSKQKFDKFLNDIDFEYKHYINLLYGTICYKDGHWSERVIINESSGLEEWVYRCTPAAMVKEEDIIYHATREELEDLGFIESRHGKEYNKLLQKSLENDQVYLTYNYSTKNKFSTWYIFTTLESNFTSIPVAIRSKEDVEALIKMMTLEENK